MSGDWSQSSFSSSCRRAWQCAHRSTRAFESSLSRSWTAFRNQPCSAIFICILLTIKNSKPFPVEQMPGQYAFRTDGTAGRKHKSSSETIHTKHHLQNEFHWLQYSLVGLTIAELQVHKLNPPPPHVLHTKVFKLCCPESSAVVCLWSCLETNSWTRQ